MTQKSQKTLRIINPLLDTCVVLTLSFFNVAMNKNEAKNYTDILKEFTPQLLKTLPIDDVTFMAELGAADLLPGDLKAEIKAKSTPAQKVDHFLDRAVKDNESLRELIKVMQKSDYSLILAKLVGEMENQLNPKLDRFMSTLHLPIFLNM